MLRLSSHIEIGDLVFDFVTEVEIESTWQNLTATCTIKLPRNLKLKEKPLEEMIKTGAPVLVRYGYDGNLRTEFEGFVTPGLKPNVPLEIKCEDAMWLFKKKPLTKSWKSVNLSEVISFVQKQNGTNYKTAGKVEAPLGKFTINQATGAQVFDALKRQYGLHCFFRKGVLVVAKPYDPATAQKHKYAFGHNIIKDGLTFIKREDVKVKVKIISNQADGKVREFEDGALDGQLRTFNFINLSDSAIKEAAQRELERLRFDGYRGTITTFGVPTADHGDIAIISDPERLKTPGGYYIDKVVKTFGVDGSRRVITLGPIAKV